MCNWSGVKAPVETNSNFHFHSLRPDKHFEQRVNYAKINKKKHITTSSVCDFENESSERENSFRSQFNDCLTWLRSKFDGSMNLTLSTNYASRTMSCTMGLEFAEKTKNNPKQVSKLAARGEKNFHFLKGAREISLVARKLKLSVKSTTSTLLASVPGSFTVL